MKLLNLISTNPVPTPDPKDPTLTRNRQTSTTGPGWLRRVCGRIIIFLGYMLSPLSWWNDLFLNLPLAIAFASVVSLIYPSAFLPAVVLGYALTNVLGFVLMHLGARMAPTAAPIKSRIALLAGNTPRKTRLAKDVVVALCYTALVVLMVHLLRTDNRSLLLLEFEDSLPPPLRTSLRAIASHAASVSYAVKELIVPTVKPNNANE
jgi:hypothetical protein